MTASTLPTAFDPTRYLRKLSGRDYLEVKFRLLWLRTERPDATIETELVQVDSVAGFALFRARVALADGGSATGYGSETRTDFADFIEKAETKALGRALAALGFGTQFCEDHALSNADGTPHPADSPVEAPVGAKMPRTAPASAESGTSSHYDAKSPVGPRKSPTAPVSGSDGTTSSTGLATPAQLKLIYLTGTRDAHLTEQEIEEECQEQYGRLPLHLTKREASAFIDSLKARAK